MTKKAKPPEPTGQERKPVKLYDPSDAIFAFEPAGDPFNQMFEDRSKDFDF